MFPLVVCGQTINKITHVEKVTFSVLSTRSIKYNIPTVPKAMFPWSSVTRQVLSRSLTRNVNVARSQSTAVMAAHEVSFIQATFSISLIYLAG